MACYPSPEDRLILTDTANHLLKRLRGRELDVVLRIFGIGEYEPHTRDEVAEAYQLSRERIRQLENRALRKMMRSSVHHFPFGEVRTARKHQRLREAPIAPTPVKEPILKPTVTCTPEEIKTVERVLNLKKFRDADLLDERTAVSVGSEIAKRLDLEPYWRGMVVLKKAQVAGLLSRES